MLFLFQHLIGNNFAFKKEYDIIVDELLNGVDFMPDPLEINDLGEYCSEMAAVFFLYKTFDNSIDWSTSEKFISCLDPTVASFIERKLFALKSFDELKRSSKKAIKQLWELKSTNEFEKSPENVCKNILLTNEIRSNLYLNSLTPQYFLGLSSLILNIESDDRVADFCCGKGRSLMELCENGPTAFFTGIESDPDYAAIAKIRFELIGVNSEIINKSVFDKDLFDGSDRKFDKIFSDIPVLSKKVAGLSGSERADWDFYEKIMEYLDEDGTAVFLATSSVLGDLKTYRSIREKFIRGGKIEAVIEFNEKLSDDALTRYEYDKKFMIVLNNKNNTKIKFIDATRIYTKCNNLIMSEEDVKRVYRLYKHTDFSNEVKTVSFETIEKNDYSLLPGKYMTSAHIFYLPGHKKIKFEKMIETIRRGTTLGSDELNERKSEQNTAYKLLLISNVQDGVVSRDLYSLTNIEKSQEKYCVPAWSECLVISKNGNPIKTAVVETDETSVLISGNFYIVKLKMDYNPWCVAAFFAAYPSILDRAARGDNLKTLYKDDIFNIDMFDLSRKEQKEIGDAYKEKVYRINRLRDELKKSKAEASNIFKTMLLMSDK